jgi:hypothetical protein
MYKKVCLVKYRRVILQESVARQLVTMATDYPTMFTLAAPSRCSPSQLPQYYL